MRIGTQQHVEEYLRSAAYNLLNTDHGLIVADKAGVGGDRDTLVVWLPAQLYPGKSFSQFEPSFVEKLERDVSVYPDAHYIILVDSLEGISRTFTEIATTRRVKIRVPALFFDAPFRVEEAPEAASAIKSLRDLDISKFIPQPYFQELNGSASITHSDLLSDLVDDIQAAEGPCIRFVVGSAGAGKSVLFKNLFGLTYRDFIAKKNRRVLSRRPIPFIPEHLRETYIIRTVALVDSFLRTDVAAPVPRETLEWMLANGCCSWMFDGLDELYSGDLEFFDYLLEKLTRPDSQAQILICARDSLLSSNDRFMEFLNSFPPGIDSAVKIYRLMDWGPPSKRRYAWIELVNRSPTRDERDPPRVTDFLRQINENPTATSLSGLPYYCSLLVERFKENRPLNLKNEFDLLSEVVSGLQRREMEKGVILPGVFEEDGLEELLETIATDYCIRNYAGTSIDDLRVYSEAVLRSSLSDEERPKLITSLVQFPLFIKSEQLGFLAFKHELLAEYLFGCQLLRTIQKDPLSVAKQLAKRPRLTEMLAFRYLVQGIGADRKVRDSIQTILQNPPLELFKVLLQIWISSAVGRTAIPSGCTLEARNLSGMKFVGVDLSDLSMRGADLTDVCFQECVLRNCAFDGASLIGTRFEKLGNEALWGCQFGALEHFEYIYHNTRLIENRTQMRKWLLEHTGEAAEEADPCATAFQFRTVFRKFVHEDGSGRRDQLPRSALTKGKIYPGAPTAKDCVDACIRYDYLTSPNFRDYIKRAPGAQYDEVVEFVRDWRLSLRLKSMMDELCPLRNCPHVPDGY
jgi:Pentapeptide repeats (8 copies)